MSARLRVGQSDIELVRGDITTQPTDAIVNAANESLAPGGGVCGAIHHAGGPAIWEECRRVAPCPTGDARATTAGRLPARYVIHAVGPVWRGGHSGESSQLASAYRASLDRADELGLASVAFPSISTGIFGYPVDRAAQTALAAVRDRLAAGSSVRRVVFVLFDDRTLEAYERALADLGATADE
jgi:O-acetyl-ADP-ribose deacetylase